MTKALLALFAVAFISTAFAAETETKKEDTAVTKPAGE